MCGPTCGLPPPPCFGPSTIQLIYPRQVCMCVWGGGGGRYLISVLSRIWHIIKPAIFLLISQTMKHTRSAVDIYWNKIKNIIHKTLQYKNQKTHTILEKSSPKKIVMTLSTLLLYIPPLSGELKTVPSLGTASPGPINRVSAITLLMTLMVRRLTPGMFHYE